MGKGISKSGKIEIEIHFVYKETGEIFGGVGEMSL